MSSFFLSSSLTLEPARQFYVPPPRQMANWQRSDVPSSVTRDATSIDTTALGTPDAEYLSSGCDIETSFTGTSILLPHLIILRLLLYFFSSLVIMAEV